jgi:hypothetical protein
MRIVPGAPKSQLQEQTCRAVLGIISLVTAFMRVLNCFCGMQDL